MGLQEAVKSVFSQYANFEGRASRSEFWYFYLFYILVSMVLVIAMGILSAVSNNNQTIPIVLGLIFFVFILAIFIPFLALTVRRLHDTDKSGWMIFIGWIPLVGPILLIVWYCTRGTIGDNRFGPDPLSAQASQGVF